MRWTRRKFVIGGVAAGVGLLGLDQYLEAHKTHRTGSTLWPESPDSWVASTVAEVSDIRLLQLTDIHFGRRPGVDAQTRDHLRRLVDQHKPDLLLVTGDLWHNNVLHTGWLHLSRSLEILQELGPPWLFTWGNHDRLDDYRAGHQALTQARNSLYRGGREAGCYTVQLLDRRGKPVWDLFCLNSMETGLGPSQHQWLRRERQRQLSRASAKHSFAVFHIPLKQFSDAWPQGRGVRLEPVSHEGEDGSTLSHLQALQTVRACLVGHDHLNDFHTQLGGIDLIYGRASGLGGYGGDQVPKGAKLYRLNAETGTYRWTSVRADGPDWEPRDQVETWKRDLWG